MKFKLTTFDTSKDVELKPTGRKDKGFYKQVTAIASATGREHLIARFYCTGQTQYCTVFIRGANDLPIGSFYFAATGRAGGYGYHKASAAFSDALTKCGIAWKFKGFDQRLAHNRKWQDYCGGLSGVGDGAILDMVNTIARHILGRRKFIIHTAHA